jgi:hypothetical protein
MNSYEMQFSSLGIDVSAYCLMMPLQAIPLRPINLLYTVNVRVFDVVVLRQKE